MLRHIENPDFADPDTALIDANPETAKLMRALADCHHPRATRLLTRLRDCQDAKELATLRAEVFRLLALSFGPAEAERRVPPLQ